MASGIYGGTDLKAVSALTKHTRLAHFPPGHVVFAQGECGSCLYMIGSGKVKVGYRHTDGREICSAR